MTEADIQVDDAQAGVQAPGAENPGADPSGDPQHTETSTVTGCDQAPKPDAGESDAGGSDAGRVVVPAGVTAQLLHLDPATLLLDANVRAEARLDRQFVGSIKDLGVLVPVVARRTADGPRLMIGQRRVLGAVEAGRATVPVYLIDAPDEAKAAQTARIIQQLAENDHRTGLRAGDRIRAHQQLALLGLTAGQIARRTRTGTGVVKTSLAVGGSPAALTALDRFDLTLTQAAVLAEFDSDPDAVTALTEVAAKRPDQFDHHAQQLRDDRAEAAAREQVTAQLVSAGVTMIEPPTYGERRIQRLDRLKPTADDPSTTEITVEAHRDCPGHAAYILDRGHRTGTLDIVAMYVCTDPARYGHADRYATTLGGERASGPMSEEQKARRREVIANNKAWDSAATVRHSWLTQFLTRKTPPRDAPQWIAATLASHGNEIHNGMQGRHPLAVELLGMTQADQWRPYSGRNHPIAEAAGKASAARATMLTLALLLGGLEQLMNRSTWRSPTPAAQVYLTALGSWGYPLSDVERLVVEPNPDRAGSRDAVAVDDDELADGEQDPADARGEDSGEPVDSPAATNADLEIGHDADAGEGDGQAGEADAA